MGRRNCASCKHYERSSIARMGWCRNPELYAAHHNHLVSADDLDCDRGAGDFWQSLEESSDQASEIKRGPIISVTTTGAPVYAVSGSSGYSNDPPPPGDSGGPPWGGDFDYYDEERTLADYARIAAPILGVIVLVILLWFWIANFLDDDNDNDDTASATATEALPTFEASPEPTGETDGTASPPAVAPTPTTGDGGVAPTTGDGTGDEPTEPSDGEPGGTEIYLGATVEVANTGGAGVNVRAEASTSSEVLTVFLDGTQVQVIGGPFEGESFIWWQVTGNEVASGWIVEDYLVVVE